jgi:UDP-2,3-diacylglucosamine pyrophosphatase LpxH
MMNRRNFLESLAGAAGVLATSQLPESVHAEVTRKVSFNALNLQEIEIPVGVPTPLKALHISDTHLVRVDDRDDELKRFLAAKRYSLYPWGEYFLSASIQYAKEHHLQLIHTGDIFDFITEANLDLTASYYNTGDWMTSVGNHEFNIYLQEANHNAEYKARSIDTVQSVYPNNIVYSSRIINDINFVNIDNSYFYITEEQHAFVEKEMQRGLPVILLCHIPFYTPEHCKHNMAKKRPNVALCGAPNEITDQLNKLKRPTYSNVEPDAEWRRISVSQHADKPTLEFTSWLKEQKNLKGILSGHCHHFFIERFSPTAIQYCVGANLRGDGFVVTFK